MSQHFVVKYKNGKEVEVKSHHIHKGKEIIETSKDATILNLDKHYDSNFIFNKKEYNQFKKFNEKVIDQVANEVDNNTGDIIQKHIYNDNDNDNDKYRDDIEKIFKKYKDTYIDSIESNGTDSHMKTIEGKLYPNFTKDLYNKNTIIYETFEKNNGIHKNIEDQNDKEFIQTLGVRINGLEKCLDESTVSLKNNNKKYKYYENEYSIESENYDSIYDKLKDNENVEFRELIDNQCKVINYNKKTKKNIEEHKKLNSHELKKTIKYIEELFKTVENEYAKTFLPESCWNKMSSNTSSINIDEITKLITSGDRNNIQYLFGFFTDKRIQHALDLRPLLYMAGGMMADYDYKNSCHPLVMWSILLNSLYSKCATYNTTPKCFARFLLPVVTNTKETSKDIKKETTKDTYELQVYRQLLDLFNNTPETNAEFIGMITIKYLYDKEHDSHKFNEYRIWYIYVFKNNDFTKSTRQDLLTGKREEFFCVSQYLNYMNNGMLFGKDNVTYSELLFFEKLSKLNNDKKIYFYKTKYDDTMLFLSLKDNLEEDSFLKNYSSLDMKRVEIKIVDKDRKTDRKKYLSLEYKTESKSKMRGGFNSHSPDYKISTTNNERQLYFNNTIISETILKYKLLTEQVENIAYYSNTIENNYISSNRNRFLSSIIYLYKYLLVSFNESQISSYNKFNKNIIILTKYQPISSNFYHIHELFNKYTIFKNFNYSDDTILSVGNNLSFIEVIKFNNYKIKNIKNILTLQQNFFSLDTETWKSYIKNISTIYTIENIEFNDTIYNLLNYNFKNNNSNEYKVIFYNVTIVNKGIGKYENYYTIPCRFVGLLFMLKNLKVGGTFIFNINNLDYKFEADMILILANYFEKYDLFKPEIHNEFKRSGVMAIFENFKGIDNNDTNYLELLTLLDTIKTIYPDEGKDFNIYDKSIREELHITKPIITKSKTLSKLKQITSFLNTTIDDKLYDKIKEFTEEINFKKCVFLQKMITILSSPEQIDIINNTKLPTPDQIMSSIIYCRKYNIPFNDNYTEDKLNNITSKTILNEMYGLQEPMLQKFKTPFQTYIVKKIVLKPTLSSRSKTQKRHSSNSISVFKTKINISKPHKKHNNNSFFNNLFNSSTKKSSSKVSSKVSSKLSSNSSKSKLTKSKSLFKRSIDISLDKALFNSNNSVVQVGLMIDSRKDFTKANPNEDYDNFKEQFRYYRSKGKDKINNLNQIVQHILGDHSVSQAWLKMYEIISECNIVPTQSKSSVFKSFHFCEAPGTFINCLNNYIYTKTNYSKFEWLAQSLHPRLAKIKDAYGLIKRHPNHWDWGVDKTGDITNPANIRYYARIIKLFSMDTPASTPFLITSDAGLEPEDPMYKLVAYTSYLAILYSLPSNGTMIYKIKDIPLELPLIWNLIYITYTNFKEMYFFKPVQNSQSREFYIIAKGYLGTDMNVLEYLMKQIDKFDKKTYEPPSTDLFNDMYPEEFVVQLSSIYDKIVGNYINSIERIIYYVDNKELIGKEYIKHIKEYVEEKNEEWLRKYKIKRLEKNKIL